MKKVFFNGIFFIDNRFEKMDICIENGIFTKISEDLSSEIDSLFVNLNNYYIFPGFIDVHVHLREPGFSYKEDISSGTMAAAHGGFTSICSMPNTNPVPDDLNNLNMQINAINEKAVISVYPYGSITKALKGKELSDMQSLADSIVAFSDDGKGIQSKQLMYEAMYKAKSLNKIIAAHCENEALLNGGYINDGKYAKMYSHKGISSESEYSQIERDLKLAQKTGAAYHVCHVSTKQSVELIRKAKSDKINVTCETAPHYLVLNDMDLQEEGRFKMNPPIRSEQDRLALIDGIKDGTIDMIATDHAPHSAEEKCKGLKNSLMGVVGLETAFPVLYTELVREKIISLEKLLELMNINPSRRFNIGGSIKIGNKADFTVFDLSDKYVISSDNFLSKGKSTPFENMEVYGKCKLTVSNGKTAWCDKEFLYV